MAEFSYAKAVNDGLVKESDKNRLACIMLHILGDTERKSSLFADIKWEHCAKDFGAAPGGFKKSVENMISALRKGDAYYDPDAPAIPVEDGTARPKAAKPRAKATPRKRKASPVTVVDGEEGDVSTAAPKKRGRPAKKSGDGAAAPTKKGRGKKASSWVVVGDEHELGGSTEPEHRDDTPLPLPTRNGYGSDTSEKDMAKCNRGGAVQGPDMERTLSEDIALITNVSDRSDFSGPASDGTDVSA